MGNQPQNQTPPPVPPVTAPEPRTFDWKTAIGSAAVGAILAGVALYMTHGRELATIGSEVSAIKSRVNDGFGDTKSQFERLEGRVDKVDSRIEKSSDGVAGLTKDVAVLTARSENTARELSDINRTLNDLRIRVTEQRVGTWIITDKAKMTGPNAWATKVILIETRPLNRLQYNVVLASQQDPLFMAKMIGVAREADDNAQSFDELARLTNLGSSPAIWNRCSFVIPSQPAGIADRLTEILKTEPEKFVSKKPTPTNYKDFLKWDSDRDGTPDNPDGQ